MALLLCAFLQFGAAAPAAGETTPEGNTATRDFVEYWSAARILLQGGNPYAPNELLALQRTAGWVGAQPLIMWNPPWTLPFILAFGATSFATGQFIWLLFHVCLILISAQFLWRLYDPAGQSSRLSWIVALSFVPVVFVLVIGQIAPLVLAGLTCFLYGARKKSNWPMAASLLVLSIKPHLLYLFWLVLLLWVFDKRRWRLAASSAALFSAAALLPLWFNAKIYSDYFALFDVPGITRPMGWPTPTLRNVLREFLGVEQTWLQLAPTFVAVAWSIGHWRRHKDQWRWHEQLPLLSLVSVVSSVFVWTYDHVVLLPAVLQAAVWVIRGPFSWHSYWAARFYLAINACHFFLRFRLSEELWYFWLAPALLLNYLIFCWERKRDDATVRAQARTSIS